MEREIRIGSRGSRLAIVQVNEVLSLLDKDLKTQSRIFDTHGDKDKTTSLAANVPTDIFTDALDQALIDKEIDIAVHSAKDLPKNLPEGLSIFALTKELDPSDAFVGSVNFTQLKDGAKIGTSSTLRKEAIKQLNPNVECVAIRGTIQERIEKAENGEYDGIIVATCALKRLGLEDKIKNIMPYESIALQGQLAVVGRSDDVELVELFAAIDARKNYGTVTLVGAGPGDPELITIKGINALKEANTVFYDFLASEELLKHAPHAEHINVGKRKGAHTLKQDELSKMLKDKSLEGRHVVRLKGGDPLIFGRGADEIAYLREYHIPVKVIPGVSSATSIPSSLGIPLTARGISSSVSFVSGHGERESEGKPYTIFAPNTQTHVFLMGLSKLDEILQSLIDLGRSQTTPVVVISKGTCADEKVIRGTIETIKEKILAEKCEPPALIIAGDVVEF